LPKLGECHLLKDPVSIAEMRAIEERGQELGITNLLMMENAGSSIANYVHEYYSRNPIGHRAKIIGIGGTGNNGGDVFAAIRHLGYWPDYLLSIILIGSEKEIRAEEARTNWQILSKIPNIAKIVVDAEPKLAFFEKEVSQADSLVIGIFGTGFKGIPKTLQLKAIEAINKLVKPLKISADIPSGMEADSGKSVYAIKSDVTITMHAPKIGMLTLEGKEKTGRIVEANIGLPF
jgi:hydroxyethylthiazole kinase-like uncharacterized protein yjeF